MTHKQLLSNFDGHWKYQQTIYNINSKKINCHINNFFLQKNDIKQNNYDISNYKTNIIQYHNKKSNIFISINNTLNVENLEQNIYKNFNNKNLKYKYSQNTQKNLNIKYIKDNILYYENFYLINSNFFLSKMFIKKNNKYCAVIFTSYIKIIDNQV